MFPGLGGATLPSSGGPAAASAGEPAPAKDGEEIVDLSEYLDKTACYARNESASAPWGNLFIGDSRLGLRSDADEQLLVHLSFREFVRVRARPRDRASVDPIPPRPPAPRVPVPSPSRTRPPPRPPRPSRR